jgi:anaerobic ribonucleoside-triphosphate reductase activating protein
MIRFASITPESYVDGPGKRAVLHLQGCSIRCPGCQNKHLWPSGEGCGQLASPEALAQALIEIGLPITITGGEPFDQAGELKKLLMAIRLLAPDRHIIVYTGYTFMDLLGRGCADTVRALADIDILVDGPYVRELDAPDMQYRGSQNQRVLDLRATFKLTGGEILTRGPVDISDEWDIPELILTEDGDLLGATPIVGEFSSVGATTSTRRCGEV